MATSTQPGDSPLKAAAHELNLRVDCSDLAQRLRLKRPLNKGSFVNPQFEGKDATLVCYADKGKGSNFHDFRTKQSGGPIDLLMLVSGLEFVAAVKELASMYGVSIAHAPRLKTVLTMPATYGQDGLGEAAVVHLHYFMAGMDWWVTEKDIGAQVVKVGDWFETVAPGLLN